MQSAITAYRESNLRLAKRKHQKLFAEKPSFETSFFVPGEAAPGGSKKAFFHAKTKKIMVVDSCKRNKSWREHVAAVAYDYKPPVPLTGPIIILCDFIMPRPKSHYGTGKNHNIIKRSILACLNTKYHCKKPDTTKLFRALEDALTGIMWRDDEQVILQIVSKQYGNNPGAQVTIQTVDE